MKKSSDSGRNERENTANHISGASLPETLNVAGNTFFVQTLFTQAEIESRICELGKEISLDAPSGETLTLLVVLHGAMIFASDLIRRITAPVEICTVHISSYHGTESAGTVNLVTPFPNLEGKRVLIIEDIIDSGKSILFLKEKLRAAKVTDYKIATLLDKPAAHDANVKADYVGFSIGRNFVIGYGLDLDGLYRNVPFIAELVQKK
jgi:hypoxanthine phosphoribosyltransferase